VRESERNSAGEGSPGVGPPPRSEASTLSPSPGRAVPPPLPASVPAKDGQAGGAQRSSCRARLLVTLACLASVLAIGAVDYGVVEQLEFHLFYFLPIALAAWSAGWVQGYAVAAAAAAVWLGSDLLSRHEAVFWSYRSWNTILELASFLIIAYAAARLRDDLDEQKRLAGELKDALNQVKQLKGLLPICAWCKRVRDDQGYWHQVEAYVSDHTDAVFSHGMCPECQEREMAQMEQRRQASPGKTRRSRARGALGEDVSR